MTKIEEQDLVKQRLLKSTKFLGQTSTSRPGMKHWLMLDDKWTLWCTCESYTFSPAEAKTCKHLEHLKKLAAAREA